MHGLVGRRRLAPVHDHDHRHGFAFGDQIVHDEIGAPLFDPAGLIFPAAMPQDEDRVALLGIVVILCGHINISPPPGVGDLRVVPLHAHLPMRYILDIVEINPRFRHFHAAGLHFCAAIALGSRYR